MSDIYSEFIDAELLSRLPNLEVKARFLVDGFLSGLHRTPFRGSSVEFKEYRDYQPGDELKLIDWKAYARTDRLHVKLREDETNMRVYLILDCSASMNYKSPKAVMSKWEYMRSVTAAFLLFLHRQRDAAALGFMGDSLEELTACSSHASHFKGLMSRLYRTPGSMKSEITDSLRKFAASVRRRSMVILFSDFYINPEEMKESLAYLRHLGCEIILFHILDPMEVSLDYNDIVLFRELEDFSEIPVSPDLIRGEYRDAVKNHIKLLSSVCSSSNTIYEFMETSVSPVHALGTYLSSRRRMK
jgi:uncharacterized protein (DUF58 family)